MLKWHAITLKPGREVPASVEIAARGFDAYLPTMQRRLSLRAGGQLVTVARFPGWVFGRFDVDLPGWERIGTGAAQRLEMKVVCNADGQPRAIPAAAVDAMKAYKPPSVDKPAPKPFTRGAPILHYTAGVPQQAVFLRYLKQGAQIELWILGRPRTVTVSVRALEEVSA